jgi:hypothetical protein
MRELPTHDYCIGYFAIARPRTACNYRKAAYCRCGMQHALHRPPLAGLRSWRTTSQPSCADFLSARVATAHFTRRGRLLAPDATLSDAGVGDGDVVTVVRIELVAEGWKVRLAPGRQ